MNTKRMLGLSFSVLAGTACSEGGDGGPALERPTGNPSPVHADCSTLSDFCILPYPNSIMEAADSSTPTGLRVRLEAPMAFAGVGAGIEAAHFDGFSPNTVVMTHVAGGVQSEGLPWDWEEAMAEDPSVRLVNADPTSPLYAQPVAVRAEAFDSGDGGDQLLILTPLQSMEPNSRYAAIVTDGVLRRDGTPLTATEAMAALLADEPPADGQDLWTYYRDLRWLAEEELGIERERIARMWDFHTRSDESLTSDLVAMRDADRVWLEENGPHVAVESIEPIGDGLRIDFTYDNPSFRPAKDSGLARDANGNPEIDHVDRLNGILILPSNATDATPAASFLFGHGLGGKGADMVALAVAMDVESGPYALGLIDWELHGSRGSGLPDLLALADPEKILNFGSVFQQSAADSVVFGAAMHAFNGMEPVYGAIDPERFFYAGVSMGAIIGTLVTAINPEVEASVLNVGGGGWTNLIRFSDLGETFGLRNLIEVLIERSGESIEGLPNDLAAEILLAIAQFGFDPGDPIHYGRHLIRDRLPGMDPDAPPIVLQESIGDSIVPNLATEALARSAGLPLIEPSVSDIGGLEHADSPTGGDPRWGMTQFRVLPAGPAAHGALAHPAVNGQIMDLFGSVLDEEASNDGDIRYRCDGPGGNCDLLEE